jgi:hypothetical protein
MQVVVKNKLGDKWESDVIFSDHFEEVVVQFISYL